MNICIAQVRSIAGDVAANVVNHAYWIEQAAKRRADLICFPELSITGYEPRLAAGLMTHPEDERFDTFQQLSDAEDISICFGVPLQATHGIQIGMVIIQPHTTRMAYSKQILHDDEKGFFKEGQTQVFIACNGEKIAPAICYESLQTEHNTSAHAAGATIYLASVAKSAAGVAKAYKHFPVFASTYGIPVLMANGIGPSDDFLATGTSSVWNNRGEMVASLNAIDEGILIFDTKTQRVL